MLALRILASASFAAAVLQHEMLVLLLSERGVQAMPVDVQELYREAPLPSRLRWAGRDTPLRLAAVLRIRFLRKRAANRQQPRN